MKLEGPWLLSVHIVAERVSAFILLRCELLSFYSVCPDPIKKRQTLSRSHFSLRKLENKKRRSRGALWVHGRVLFLHPVKVCQRALNSEWVILGSIGWQWRRVHKKHLHPLSEVNMSAFVDVFRGHRMGVENLTGAWRHGPLTPKAKHRLGSIPRDSPHDG